MEDELRLLREQFKTIEQENKTLKGEINKLNSRQRHAYFSDEETDADTDISDTESSEPSSSTGKKHRKKKDSLTRLLKTHQTILKELGNPEANSVKLNQLLNGLSETNLDQVIKSSGQSVPDVPNPPSPPNLSNNENAKIGTLKEAITSLKDLYRSQFSGTQGEDLVGFLNTTGTLAKDSKLSRAQFYTLLKSRVTMGSNLYNEISFHENVDSSLKTLFKELVPLYSNFSNYATVLHKLNTYRPAQNTPANQILAQIKNLVLDLSSYNTNPVNKKSFIFQMTRNKILELYPYIAPQLLERESMTNSNSMHEFSRIFLSLAPLIEHQNKRNKTVHETRDISPQRTQENEHRVHVIKLTPSIAAKFADACYKCGNHSTQPPHKARECTLYQGCALAYYVCSKCRSGVHLPRDCKNKPAENINSIKVEIIPEEEEPTTSAPKNLM